MKHLCITIIIALLTLAVPQIARADDTLYLPFIGGQDNATATGTHFVIDHDSSVTRLVHITENGGRERFSPDDPIICGDQHRLEVHVFDNQGAGETTARAVNGRLNSVQVLVAHADGSEQVEVTGAEGNYHGVARFELQARATVRVIVDVNGEQVTSDALTVSTVPAAISPSSLKKAGYCTDNASCRAFIQADTCRGDFSWNVVFKRGG